MSNTLHPQLIKNKISELLKAPKLLVADALINGAIKSKPGLYTFWWVGDRTELLRKMKENPYYLKGPHYSSKTNQEMIPVTFSKEWLKAATQPDGALCLYVGKSTNIRQRINGHLRLGVKNIWKFNEEKEYENFDKDKVKNSKIAMKFGFGKKPNTVSQLRIGLERIFKEQSVAYIKANVAITTVALEGDDVINRFYTEDALISQLYPLFNVDAER